MQLTEELRVSLMIRVDPSIYIYNFILLVYFFDISPRTPGLEDGKKISSSFKVTISLVSIDFCCCFFLNIHKVIVSWYC